MIVSLRYTGPVVTGQSDRALVGGFLVAWGISARKWDFAKLFYSNWYFLSSGIAGGCFTILSTTMNHRKIHHPISFGGDAPPFHFLFPSTFKVFHKQIPKNCLPLSECMQ